MAVSKKGISIKWISCWGQVAQTGEPSPVIWVWIHVAARWGYLLCSWQFFAQPQLFKLHRRKKDDHTIYWRKANFNFLDWVKGIVARTKQLHDFGKFGSYSTTVITQDNEPCNRGQQFSCRLPHRRATIPMLDRGQEKKRLSTSEAPIIQG